mmetsp:Transcript_19912/g.39085  ORF Transcript_19912/g.39085 Transcript_19912/m.39085 type:complete len:145 (-) Transcript_19912:386-820(-)|eukprot:CAMPEP_0171496840 /NCGR_PEP_ID=MMETSP0958-20121227/6930_1 /TAXON_ID=87120 /ORGANISM="Aurantiochytrium limacinum, Strain ATCCMYA-1381" /LENGTH=144 /DNA_ID=CAMNT_0012030997 /DNA_START=90 /DNA_END=524 /DNA_ORIENTATION=+
MSTGAYHLAALVARANKSGAKPGRAQRAIYAGKTIQFGNKVSHAQNRTRRKWNPNVQRTTLESELLGEKMQLRLTTHALRCIKKAGSLDHFLITMPHLCKDSQLAMGLREKVLEVLQEKGVSPAQARANILEHASPVAPENKSA